MLLDLASSRLVPPCCRPGAASSGDSTFSLTPPRRRALWSINSLPLLPLRQSVIWSPSLAEPLMTARYPEPEPSTSATLAPRQQAPSSSAATTRYFWRLPDTSSSSLFRVETYCIRNNSHTVQTSTKYSKRSNLVPLPSFDTYIILLSYYLLLTILFRSWRCRI